MNFQTIRNRKNRKACKMPHPISLDTEMLTVIFLMKNPAFAAVKKYREKVTVVIKGRIYKKNQYLKLI